jgi:hypothetical protein
MSCFEKTTFTPAVKLFNSVCLAPCAHESSASFLFRVKHCRIVALSRFELASFELRVNAQFRFVCAADMVV